MYEANVMGGETYLAVANHYNDVSYNQNSKIYRWDGSLFQEFQSIPTCGATCFDYTEIDGLPCGVFCNPTADTSMNIDSVVYRALLQ